MNLRGEGDFERSGELQACHEAKRVHIHFRCVKIQYLLHFHMNLLDPL